VRENAKIHRSLWSRLAMRLTLLDAGSEPVGAGFSRRVASKRFRGLLALFAFIPPFAHATCAIAVWTPDRMILGSDSRETFLSPEYGQRSSNECKLRQIGPYYVIVAGIMLHQRTGFNVFDILGESIARTNSVTEAAEEASNEIARRYARVLRLAREDSSGSYMRRLESNAPVFAIAGFSNGRPYLAHYEYDLVRGTWAWRKRIYGGSREGGSMSYVYLCDPHSIEMFKRQHPRWQSEDPLKVVPGMIASAARWDSAEVGGPTALLVLDSAGPRWESSGVCPKSPAARPVAFRRRRWPAPPGRTATIGDHVQTGFVDCSVVCVHGECAGHGDSRWPSGRS
jgi:hypothetical protein